MFIGSKLTKKDELAKEFGKQMLCLSKESLPCEKCKSCVEMNNYNHPDFAEIKLENDANNIKIEQIRKLQEDIIKKTNSIRKKFI